MKLHINFDIFKVGYIYIKHNYLTAKYRADDFDRIYDHLTKIGYSHDEADDIASWAEIACLDEEYRTGNQDEISIQQW